MMRQTLTLAALVAAALTQTACHAQNDGFRTMPDGLKYKIVKDAPGRNAALGDFLDIHLQYRFKDSLLFSSRNMNAGQPVPVQVQRPGFGGDLMEGFLYLSEGDSAIIKVPLDSLLKMGAPSIPGMEAGKGQTIDYEVQVVRVRTADQMRQEQEAQASRQKGVDEALLQEHFTKNGIKPMKTASGLYYTMSNPGSGKPLQTGMNVTMNYTGTLLNGQKFDSNVDPAFSHVQPFKFVLGQGQVIRGWDEGVALFKKGGKGTLYIPSPMAYGERSPSPAIPANSVLVFDIEVVDADQGVASPQPMQPNAPEKPAAPAPAKKAAPKKK